jgi:single-stranded-DNA-specific exonuclease
MALDLLNAKSHQEATAIATELKTLNDQRKEITQQGEEDAITKVEDGSMMEDKVLVVYLENCHQSVAGIVAGRLRDRYYRPTIILTPGSEDGEIKGSGRSIEAYDLYDGLCQCEDLLVKFGGHTVAAGLTLNEGDVESLRELLNRNCQLTDEDLIEKISIDIALPFKEATLELVQ